MIKSFNKNNGHTLSLTQNMNSSKFNLKCLSLEKNSIKKVDFSLISSFSSYIKNESYEGSKEESFAFSFNDGFFNKTSKQQNCLYSFERQHQCDTSWIPSSQQNEHCELYSVKYECKGDDILIEFSQKEKQNKNTKRKESKMNNNNHLSSFHLENSFNEDKNEIIRETIIIKDINAKEKVWNLQIEKQFSYCYIQSNINNKNEKENKYYYSNVSIIVKKLLISMVINIVIILFIIMKTINDYKYEKATSITQEFKYHFSYYNISELDTIFN